MSPPPTKTYPPAFQERAVQLAVESDQSMAQTARDLGLNEHTLHPWIGKSHRAARQEQQVQGEHRYAALKRLCKDNARVQEEWDMLKQAAASVAPPLP
jgi:transposase